MGKYLGLFVSEAGEHLEALGADLVRLERAGREGAETAALVDAMFRHAHSVKGMAAAMQFDAIARLAHRVEDLLGALRGRSGKAPPEVVDALLLATDGLQAMVTGAGIEPPAAPDPKLLERLSEAAASLRGPAAPGPAARPPEPSPSPPPPETPPPAPRRLEVGVEIAASCPVPAVRAFLVLKKLAGLGTVLGSSPSAEDLKAGRIPGKRLEVELESGERPQAVERALSQISDLASVVVRGEAAALPPLTATPAPPPSPAAEGPRTVRVRTELLDYFMDTVGELILATARLREVGRALVQPQRRAHEEGVDRLHTLVKELHGKVMAVRMTPIAVVTDRLPRAARDLARKSGKQVEVVVAGAEIEIDRAILEELGDPLLHLVRNSVDHGLEPPQVRIQAGKAATGRIAVSARRERDRVILEIADDGRGMDPRKLREAAVARGAIRPEQAAALSDREALGLACLPGVSTAEVVTDVSGRGVGMDAVKRVVEAVGGTLEIESTAGLGSRFLLRLPLTVAVQPVLLVRVADEVLGLPIAKVHGAAEVDLERLETSQGGPMLAWGGGHVPVQDLGRLLGIPDPPRRNGARQVVVADSGGGHVGLAVDALLGQEEAVLKPLAPPLDRVQGLSAVTVLGSGRPVFVLDVPRLLAA
ncbi:MAG TPA: chemotaxis protein CheA [Anaeromyxobacteraceae bacterium]|nr:chemotaxis protein CheA [Anaeromyxobacteraceae bacterium]